MRTTPINAYLYQQFKDDKDLASFVQAYNAIAQDYVSWFNNIGLPIYTLPACSGLMLDWIGKGIYGIPRQNLTSGNVNITGRLNTNQLDTLQIDASAQSSTLQNIAMTDDIYKRVLTWNLYRGDGYTFSTQWLKRRVLRFILGVNGADVLINSTNTVSVTFGVSNAVTIQYRTGTTQVPMVNVLNACINTGILDLPMQYTFSITAV